LVCICARFLFRKYKNVGKFQRCQYNKMSKKNWEFEMYEKIIEISGLTTFHFLTFLCFAFTQILWHSCPLKESWSAFLHFYQWTMLQNFHSMCQLVFYVTIQFDIDIFLIWIISYRGYKKYWWCKQTVFLDFERT